MDINAGLADVPAEMFPFKVTFSNPDTGEELHVIDVAEPGVMSVPGKDELGMICDIRVVTESGTELLMRRDGSGFYKDGSRTQEFPAGFFDGEDEDD